MSKASILFVSYHFYPSLEVGAKRPSETAAYLQRSGFDVTVLRAIGRTDSKHVHADDLNVLSVRVPAKRMTAAWKTFKGIVRRDASNGTAMATEPNVAASRSASCSMRPFRWLRRQVLAYDTLLQGHKLWIFKSAVKLLWLCRRRRFDLIIASGPPGAGYVCGWAASKLAKAPLLLDMRDPWYLHGDKERSDDTVVRGHPLTKLEDRIARHCVAQSMAIVAASPGIRSHTAESFAVLGKPIYVIRNGYDELAVVEQPPPHGRLEMLYAGTLYLNRNPFPFLEAVACALRKPSIQKDKIEVRLVGKCESWNGIALQPWLRERGLEGVVRVLPFADAERLRQLVVDSNVLLNFAQGQPRQIPAKSYEYLAAQRDVLVIAERRSDVADLFREAGVGEVVDCNDSALLASIIESLYERHVACYRSPWRANFDAKRYGRAARLAEFASLVEGIISRRSVDSAG